VARLSRVRDSWAGPDFATILGDELQALGGEGLPLHLGLNEGGMVDASRLQVTVIRSEADPAVIRATVGLFFTEVVGGCSCGDEPEAKPVYCEMRVHIDRGSAETRFEMLPG
jgi:hypothetical protein